MKRIFSKRVIVATAISAIVIGGFYYYERTTILSENLVNEAAAAQTASVSLPYKSTFSLDGIVNATSVLDDSSSPYWWVSSGAYMELKNGTARTVQGELPIGSKWQQQYALANSADTDGGIHPQNIFRLVLRTNWKDVSSELYYKINKYNLSAGPNRNASNGLFQMTRYVDQYNLYYTGIRVDGYAVIKKKILGKYYTMAYLKVLPGTFNPLLNPNLLPTNTWIGMRSVVKNLDAKRVQIQIFTDFAKTGTWKLVASSIDDGVSFGGPALGAGHIGIRTDFMDAEFDDFLLANPS
jgi:hypothetical protein